MGPVGLFAERKISGTVAVIIPKKWFTFVFFFMGPKDPYIPVPDPKFFQGYLTLFGIVLSNHYLKLIFIIIIIISLSLALSSLSKIDRVQSCYMLEI
jgi:hypothetical protein